MTRISLIIMLIISFVSTAYAQLQRPISGVVAASSGPVEVRYLSPTGEDIGRIAGIGDPIYLDDEIVTGPDTSLQILLKDQTVFSIGPNAVLVFDEFIYDPAGNSENSLTASVKKGAFKFISGKISKKSPEAMKLKLPNATASIRGTTVAGRVQENGDADVFLLSGAISVQNIINPVPVDIIQPGWGTSITAAGAIADPFQLTVEAINDVLSEATVEAALSEEAPLLSTNAAAAASAAVLTADEQVIAEFTELATDTFAAAGETEVNVADLFGLILSNADLVRQLEEQGLDIADAPTDINYAYLDTRLISMLASGAGPEFMVLQADGNGGHFLNHADLDPAMANLVSDSYSGSVTFASSGLAFAPRENATSVSGTASYNYTIFYDDASASGSFSIDGLEMNGVTYGDLNVPFTNKMLNGANQVQYEGDSDDYLFAGQEVFEVELATGNFTDDNNLIIGSASLNSSLGSITDGSDVVDGILGSTNIMVMDNNDGSIRSRVEKYEVGRRN